MSNILGGECRAVDFPPRIAQVFGGETTVAHAANFRQLSRALFELLTGTIRRFIDARSS